MKRKGTRQQAKQVGELLTDLLTDREISILTLSELCQTNVSSFVEGTELPSAGDCVLMGYHLGANPNAILAVAGYRTHHGYDVLAPWWSGKSEDSDKTTLAESEHLLRHISVLAVAQSDPRLARMDEQTEGTKKRPEEASWNWWREQATGTDGPTDEWRRDWRCQT
jgi:hypothetical protein